MEACKVASQWVHCKWTRLWREHASNQKRHLLELFWEKRVPAIEGAYLFFSITQTIWIANVFRTNLSYFLFYNAWFFQGTAGPQGAIGLPGPSGPQGVDGRNGAPGAAGPKGAKVRELRNDSHMKLSWWYSRLWDREPILIRHWTIKFADMFVSLFALSFAMQKNWGNFFVSSNLTIKCLLRSRWAFRVVNDAAHIEWK